MWDSQKYFRSIAAIEIYALVDEVIEHEDNHTKANLIGLSNKSNT